MTTRSSRRPADRVAGTDGQLLPIYSVAAPAWILEDEPARRAWLGVVVTEARAMGCRGRLRFWNPGDWFGRPTVVVEVLP